MYESRISWEAEKFADYFDLLADRENFRNHRRFLVYCVFEIRFYINLDILIGIHFISFLFFFFYFRPIISNRMKWKIDSLIPSMTINFSTNGRVFIRDNSKWLCKCTFLWFPRAVFHFLELQRIVSMESSIMARHATAFYCNAVPYIFYIMRYERETWIIVSLMRAAGYYSKYQSVCVFFFSNFTAGCKWFAEAKAEF